MSANRFCPIVLLAAVALCLAACAPTRTGVVPARGNLEPEAILEASFGDPIFAHGSDYLMLPYAVEVYRDRLAAPMARTTYERNNSWFRKSDQSWLKWNNLAFVHRETHEGHLLLDRRGIITQFWYPPVPPPHDVARPLPEAPALLILGIAEQDTTGDGLIDGYDASTGYIADLSGRELTRITPLGSNMQRFQFDRDGRWLYVYIRHDANDDGQFNGLDNEQCLAVNLSAPAMGVPLIGEALEARAKDIVLEE